MKKIFFSIILCVIFCGCSREKNTNLNNIEFSCEVLDNGFLFCNNMMFQFDENNNITSLVSDEGNNELFEYEYDNNGNVISIIKKNMQKVLIFYDKNYNISSIDYILDPMLPEELRTIISYEISYDSNIIKEIKKTYNNTDTLDIIKYEHYSENGIDYIKEIKTLGNRTYIRTLIKNKDAFLTNILEQINYLPDIYADILNYNPYYNYNELYDYKQTPILGLKIKSIEIIDSLGNTIEKTEYFYDKKGRFLRDSNNLVIHRYEEHKDEVIRYTIYANKINSYVTEYYKYETHYLYKNDKLISLKKTEEQKISLEEYNKYKKNFTN